MARTKLITSILTIALFGAVGAISATHARASLAVALLTCLGFTAFLPLWILPSLALTAFALWPAAYLPLSSTLQTITPGSVLLLMWGLKMLATPKRRAIRWNVSVILLIGWLIYKTLTSIAFRTSLDWAMTAIIDVILTTWAAMRADGRTRNALHRTWLLLGTILSAAAFFERVSSHNPLSGLYASANPPLIQHWSVYRSMTTLGHPLVNGTFFASTAVLAISGLVSKNRSSSKALLISCGGLSIVGVLMTVSRSSVAATAAGLGLALFLFIVTQRKSFATTLVFVALSGLGLFILLTSSLLATRNGSSEAAGSSTYRTSVVTESKILARSDHYVGAGPSTSQRQFDHAGANMTVENGGLQLLLSIGIPGIALSIMSLRKPVMIALRRGNTAALAATAAFLVGGLAFNFWESNLAALGLFGLLLALCVGPSDVNSAAPLGQRADTFAATSEPLLAGA
jgi:hypothetical protein